jgi:hypothetical protein
MFIFNIIYTEHTTYPLLQQYGLVRRTQRLAAGNEKPAWPGVEITYPAIVLKIFYPR